MMCSLWAQNAAPFINPSTPESPMEVLPRPMEDISKRISQIPKSNGVRARKPKWEGPNGTRLRKLKWNAIRESLNGT